MKLFRKVLEKCDSAGATFPFAFVVDNELRVMELGRSMEALVPDLTVGDHLSDWLTVERPTSSSEWTKDCFQRAQGKLLLFRVADSDTRLRAECFCVPDYIAFNTTPVLSEIHSLETLGLSFSHFPVIDSISDSMFVWSMQQQTVREVNQIAEKLAASNDKLKAEAKIRQQEFQRREAMERERQELHDELIVASREAGKAEIATGVLHNVGNVMNSVTVSAGILRDTLEQKVFERIGGAAELIGQHQNDLASFFESERGQHFLPFLDQVQGDLQGVLDEIAELLVSVDHVNAVVAAQQSFASSGGLYAEVHVEEIINATIQITGETFRQNSIKLVRELGSTDSAILDKQKLIQILVNLFRNAKHAILDADSKDRTVTVRSKSVNGWLIITVSDTGIGISRENLGRVFQHGFSTRKKSGGHGFGLHHSYYAMDEMGGTIAVASEGLGKGATFILRLPVQPPAEPKQRKHPSHDRLRLENNTTSFSNPAFTDESNHPVDSMGVQQSW